MTLKSGESVVIQGLGQMGGVFAHAALRAGASVHPWLRDVPEREVLERCPDPRTVVVAVGEADLVGALAVLPDAYRGRALLLQNELLPSMWRAAGVPTPTVAVVWFEKKATTPIRPILPTPIAGPGASFWVEALSRLQIPARIIEDAELLFELVAKNVYILTTNIAGLEVGGDVGTLLSTHRELAHDVAREVIAVQRALATESGDAIEGLDEARLLKHLDAARDGDPAHGCKGRSAPARLARMLGHASRLNVAIPRSRAIAASAGVD